MPQNRALAHLKVATHSRNARNARFWSVLQRFPGQERDFLGLRTAKVGQYKLRRAMDHLDKCGGGYVGALCKVFGVMDTFC